jgi:hypothetical protein
LRQVPLPSVLSSPDAVDMWSNHYTGEALVSPIHLISPVYVCVRVCCSFFGSSGRELESKWDEKGAGAVFFLQQEMSDAVTGGVPLCTAAQDRLLLLLCNLRVVK